MKSMHMSKSLTRVVMMAVVFVNLLLAPARPASAATLTVNSLADTNDGFCNSTNCTLREAINAANATPESDVIQFSLDGIIRLASSLPGIASAGGALTIDVGEWDIRISGEGAYRPFLINTGASLTLQNIDFGYGYSSSVGGGIYNKGTLVVRDGTISYNRAHDDGGGIYNEGTLTLEDTSVSNNTSDGGCGGGLYIYKGSVTIIGGNFSSNVVWSDGGAIYNRYDGESTGGDLIINGTAFTLNDSTYGNGGAIYNKSDVVIDQATFTNNKVEDNGGGFYNDLGGNFKIKGSLFNSNRSYFGNGGGMYAFGVHRYSYCNNCTFSQNDAYEDGGGFYLLNGHVDFIRTRFSSNTAHRDGGGGYNSSGLVILDEDFFYSNTAEQHGGGFYNSSNTLIRYSTFSGNSALDNGGGVYHAAGAYHVLVMNSTLYKNSANLGGGLYMLSSADITNCTLSTNHANIAGGGGGLYAGYYLTEVRNSIIANSSSGGNCAKIGSPPTNNGNNIDSGKSCGWGSNNGSMSNTNPLLGTLKDNGGFTKTMALLAGSPAIDGVTFNAPNECPEDDQREYPRPFEVRCDIGAVEQYYRLLLPIVRK